MRKKLAILGKLETKFAAPFEDESVEIWSMNKHVDEKLIPRVDIWFDIHNNTKANTYNKDAQITKDNFPFEECHKLVGGMYFNNTVSYLIAYAIIKGFEEISLYGMRFYSDHERRQGELYNVRQMIFFARGRGIKVRIPVDKEYLLPEVKVMEGREFDQ